MTEKVELKLTLKGEIPYSRSIYSVRKGNAVIAEYVSKSKGVFASFVQGVIKYYRMIHIGEERIRVPDIIANLPCRIYRVTNGSDN